MNRNEIRSTLDEESVRLSKALGQNLLHDQNVPVSYTHLTLPTICSV